MWKAGTRSSKAKMKEEKALLAGEMSGHLFFADRYFGYDDADFTLRRACWKHLFIRSKDQAKILADFPKPSPPREIRVAFPITSNFRW